MYCEEEEDKEEKMDGEEVEDSSGEMREVGDVNEKRQRSTVHKVIKFVINDTCKPKHHVQT